MIKKRVVQLVWVSLFTIVTCLNAQDTVEVKLGPINSTDRSFELLKSSQVLLNKLIPAKDFQIQTVNKVDSTTDVIGLREISETIELEGFIRTTPVLISNNLLLGHNDNASDWDDIIDESVGVLSGSLASQEIKKHTQFFNTYDSISSLYAAFFNGEIDYIIVEASIAKILLNSNIEGDKIEIINSNLFKSHIGFWVTKNNSKLLNYLNSKIKDLRGSKNLETFKSKYYVIPTNFRWTWGFLMVFVILLSLIIAGVYLFKNQNLLKQFIGSYKLELNGILQIRPLPGIRFVSNEGEIKTHFQDAYLNFQEKYPNINVLVDFNNTAVKLNFNSNSDIKIANKNYLMELASSIKEMISIFPTDQFIIDLNLSGSYYNFQERNKFSIINKNTDVEFVDADINKTVF